MYNDPSVQADISEDANTTCVEACKDVIVVQDAKKENTPVDNSDGSVLLMFYQES